MAPLTSPFILQSAKKREAGLCNVWRQGKWMGWRGTGRVGACDWKNDEEREGCSLCDSWNLCMNTWILCLQHLFSWHSSVYAGTPGEWMSNEKHTAKIYKKKTAVVVVGARGDERSHGASSHSATVRARSWYKSCMIRVHQKRGSGLRRGMGECGGEVAIVGWEWWTPHWLDQHHQHYNERI